MPIFQRMTDGSLRRLEQIPYEREELLQQLLARSPELLAGDQNGSPRWLLIAREMPTPGDETLSSRWSLDHLFVDLDAVPTLVEVKRSSDTRIRREVVGQLLDYAANAVRYWPIQQLITRFEATCRSLEPRTEPAVVLRAFLGDEDVNEEDFWSRVGMNLKAGRVRLVFVSDSIPTELRRVVEFLNEQMNPAEVIAIEVQQYVSADRELQALVPRVLGRTAAAEATKRSGSSSSQKWDEQGFLEHLRSNAGEEAVRRVLQLKEWAQPANFTYGVGDTHAAWQIRWPHSQGEIWPFTVRSLGRVEVPFGVLKARAPFNEQGVLEQYRLKLNAIDGVSLPEDLTRWPTFPLEAILPAAGFETLKEALVWFRSQVDGVRSDRN